MRLLRPTLAFALAATATVPLAAGGPASAGTLAGTPGDRIPHSLARATDTAAAAADARERLAERTGRTTRKALAAAMPAAALHVSTTTGSVRIALAADGTVSGTTSSLRYEVSAAPAGDAIAYSPAPMNTTVIGVPASDGAVSTDYVGAQGPVAWAPAGDGFVTESQNEWVQQFTNPDAALPLDVPTGATGPAVSPFADAVYFRVPVAGGGSDIHVVPAEFSGISNGSVTPADLGLGAYAPGDPAVSLVADTTVYDATEADLRLAFLGTAPDANAGTRQLFLGEPTDTTPAAVADAGFACDEVAAPAFNPDRSLIAYVRATNQACTTFEVRTLRLGTGGTDSLLYTMTGAPRGPVNLSWEANNPGVYDDFRIDGANRYEVSAFAAFVGSDPDTTDTVVLAGGLAYADALAGGPLAYESNGPLVLTAPDRIRPETQEVLDGLLPDGGLVYILGGTGTVSAAVETALKKQGYSVIRIGGANRFEVAVNVAKRLDVLRGGKPDTAFVSSGTAFADALVAGSPASLFRSPILLSNGSTLPAVTASYLATLPQDGTIFAVGGSGAGAVSSDPRTVVIGGANRYEVAGNVADAFFPTATLPALADGRNWPDAASAGPLMAGWQQPILLTSGTGTLPAPTKEYLLRSRSAVDDVVVFGGTASVPQAAHTAAARAGGRQTTFYGPFAFLP